MKLQSPARLTAEQLENRECPALTTTLASGTLTISGSATNVGDTITIREIAANQFQVEDGAAVVATKSAVTHIRVNLTNVDDNLAVNFGGFTMAGNLTVNLGSGTNTMTIVNGTLTGILTVNGYNGDDTMTIGQAANALTLNGGSRVYLGNGVNTLSVVNSTVNKGLIFVGGTALDTVTLGDGVNATTITGGVVSSEGDDFNDVFTINKLVSITGDVNTYYANNITVSNGATITGSANFYGGMGGNTVEFAGKATADVRYLAPWYYSHGTTSLHLAPTAIVGRDLIFTSSLLNTIGNSLTTDVGSTVTRDLSFTGTNFADTVTLAGGIGRNLTISTRTGPDIVSVASTTTIGNRATIWFGNGNNTLDFNGTVSNSLASTIPSLYILAGTGTNIITIGATANVTGNASVLLGNGVNLLDLRDNATITGKLTASGGNNAASKFRGSVKPNHTTLTINAFPIIDGSANP